MRMIGSGQPPPRASLADFKNENSLFFKRHESEISTNNPFESEIDAKYV